MGVTDELFGTTPEGYKIGKYINDGYGLLFYKFKL
jgi:hypothetical protein